MDYNEISWDEFEKADKRGPVIKRIETVGWIIGGVIVLGALLAFFPVRDLFLSHSALQQKYGTHQYPWLNRCDQKCEQRVNASYLNAQRSCTALNTLFLSDRTRYLFEWRMAVDDRASSLGCPGYPKSTEVIRDSVQSTTAAASQQHDDRRQVETDRLQAETTQTLERFGQSLQAGKLTEVVKQSVIDPSDDSLMIITVSAEWFEQSVSHQQQVAEVLWQKWAAIRSPDNPKRSHVLIQTASGSTIFKQ